MNAEFAKKELRKLSEIAQKDKDGFFACYFSRISGEFVGQNVGMTDDDAMVIIDKIINIFGLDRAALAHHVAPAIIIPFKGGKDG